MSFRLTSKDFSEGELLGHTHVLSAAYGFGCDGKNVSPQLSWHDAPEGTQSFALTCFDPDAPTGSGFWHWLVVNIPANVSALPQGAGDPTAGIMPPAALETRTDFGAPGYGGPCSPPGSNMHRYVFSIHALDVDSLPVTADTSAAVVGFHLHQHSLARADLIGIFRR